MNFEGRNEGVRKVKQLKLLKKKNHNNQKVKVSFLPNTLNGKNLTNQLHKFIGVLVAI